MARRYLKPTLFQPASGEPEPRAIPSPDHGGQPLPAEGDEVEYSPYWDKRVMDGDVAEMTENDVVDLKAKRLADHDAAEAAALVQVEAVVEAADSAPAPLVEPEAFDEPEATDLSPPAPTVVEELPAEPAPVKPRRPSRAQ